MRKEKETEKRRKKVVLDADGDRWHSLECLDSGSVLFECKDGAYEPLGEGEIMVK